MAEGSTRRASRATSPALPADRLAARIMAHALLEQTQVSPDPVLVDRLLDHACGRGWGEVEVLSLHNQLIHACLTRAHHDEVRARSDALLAVARTTDEEVLVALALASRALSVDDVEHPESLTEDLPGCLSRAVALLDDVAAGDPAEIGLRGLELPMAYVECGQAYHRWNLWELEEEMYVRAAAALDLPLGEPMTEVSAFTRRVLVINRLESHTSLACALLELGDRDGAARVAAARPHPTPEERADLPGAWRWEALALERLLDVVAGTPDLEGCRTTVPAEHFEELAVSTWSGYRGALLVAAAVGSGDAGHAEESRRLAERAVALLDEYMPSLRTLALHLAAQGPGPQDAALRYAHELARRRWHARLQVLGAARARLTAERLLRQNETLSRQVYVDALTGLANRHALGRHLTRLRRSHPAARLCVVLVDLDHFKSVNDTFGHAVGDDVLRAVGSALARSVRPADLAVRLGGDEFMLLIDLAASPVDARARAHEVVDRVATHSWDDVAPGLLVTASAGQATGAAGEVDELVRLADDRLYRAKADGRGRAVSDAP